MAYAIKNINILDLRPSTGIGVAIPFSIPSVFRTVYTTKEQIRYNLINFILTNPGERVFEPRFGLGLRKKLFEQITDNTLESIRDLVISGIETYFTNIEIVVLDIIPIPNNNIINISFTYKLISTDENDEIIINLENGK